VRGWKVLASMTTLAMILSPVGSARSSLAQPSGRWAICGEWRSVQPRFHEFRPEAVAVVSPYVAWLVGGPAYDQGPPIALRWNGMSWVRTRVRCRKGSIPGP
jgi:hypothetical protein